MGWSGSSIEDKEGWYLTDLDSIKGWLGMETTDEHVKKYWKGVDPKILKRKDPPNPQKELARTIAEHILERLLHGKKDE
jgi:hypothetical protein